MADDELGNFFGAGGEKGTETIPAEESFTGEEIDLSAIDNEMKRNWYKEVQAKHTKTRQTEKAELDNLRKVADEFKDLQGWEEYQIWTEAMRKKFPEKGEVPIEDAKLAKRVEALEGKTGEIDTIHYKEELGKLKAFIQEKNLPPVDKYFPNMRKILNATIDNNIYTCENCGAEVKGDGKSGLEMLELYALAIFPDLIKLMSKGTPPHLETSSGRAAATDESKYFDKILQTKRGI